MEINLLRQTLRRRLAEYRYFKIEKGTSIHVNAIEIALDLIDYAVEKNRTISKQEQNWFNAGWELMMVFQNSDWEDLLELYYELGEHAKGNYFLTG